MHVCFSKWKTTTLSIRWPPSSYRFDPPLHLWLPGPQLELMKSSWEALKFSIATSAVLLAHAPLEPGLGAPLWRTHTNFGSIFLERKKNCSFGHFAPKIMPFPHTSFNFWKKMIPEKSILSHLLKSPEKFLPPRSLSIRHLKKKTCTTQKYRPGVVRKRTFPNTHETGTLAPGQGRPRPMRREWRRPQGCSRSTR